MTTKELEAALKEWGGDNKNKHYLFIAVDGEEHLYGAKGSNALIAYALANVMRDNKVLAEAIAFAMRLGGHKNI